MNTAKRRFWMRALQVFYLALMVLCLSLTIALLAVNRHDNVGLSALLSLRIKLAHLLALGLMLLAWHIVFCFCGFYRSSRFATKSSLVGDAIIATTLAFVVLLLAAKTFCIATFSYPFAALFFLISSFVIVTARVAIRLLLEHLRIRDRNLRYILIIGTNSRAVEFARRLECKPELGYRVRGFVDNDWPGRDKALHSTHRVCCNFSGLSSYLRRDVIDEVALYLPFRSFYEEASQIVGLCEQQGITVRLAPNLFNLKIARPHADDLDGDWHITAHCGSIEGWALSVKRLLDVIVSASLLLVLSPIFVIVGTLIKLTSDGPIFFVQERVGLNKRKFFMYKFRTMIPNADELLPSLETLNEASGPVFKISDDPRITPIGRFLRRTSIDELPQLLNVLTGEMSLVGPRPLPVRDYEGFSEDWQRRRFSVRPGITCLWQINGRSSVPFEEWMLLDLQYVDEWSIWLDLKILVRTVPAVLKGSGAV